MALTVQQIQPVAQLSLVLGVLRRLEVATVIDRLIPPYLAHMLSCGRGAVIQWQVGLYRHHRDPTFTVGATRTTFGVQTPATCPPRPLCGVSGATPHALRCERPHPAPPGWGRRGNEDRNPFLAEGAAAGTGV